MRQVASQLHLIVVQAGHLDQDDRWVDRDTFQQRRRARQLSMSPWSGNVCVTHLSSRVLNARLAIKGSGHDKNLSQSHSLNNSRVQSEQSRSAECCGERTLPSFTLLHRQSQKGGLVRECTCLKSQGQMVSFMPSSSSPVQSAVCEPCPARPMLCHLPVTQPPITCNVYTAETASLGMSRAEQSTYRTMLQIFL